MKTLNCPKGHGPMGLNTVQKEMTYKGVDIAIAVEVYTCPECGMEAGTVQSAGAVQRAIADACRARFRTRQGAVRTLFREKG